VIRLSFDFPAAWLPSVAWHVFILPGSCLMSRIFFLIQASVAGARKKKLDKAFFKATSVEDYFSVRRRWWHILAFPATYCQLRWSLRWASLSVDAPTVERACQPARSVEPASSQPASSGVACVLYYSHLLTLTHSVEPASGIYVQRRRLLVYIYIYTDFPPRGGP